MAGSNPALAFCDSNPTLAFRFQRNNLSFFPAQSKRFIIKVSLMQARDGILNPASGGQCNLIIFRRFSPPSFAFMYKGGLNSQSFIHTL